MSIHYKIAHFREEQPPNTPGGTALSGDWRTRILNQEVFNNIIGASLNTSLSQITLPEGNYQIKANCPAWNTFAHQAILKDITNDQTKLIGTSVLCSTYWQSYSFINGYLPVYATTIFELQHKFHSTSNLYGMGYNITFTNCHYSNIIIKQILET